MAKLYCLIIIIFVQTRVVAKPEADFPYCFIKGEIGCKNAQKNEQKMLKICQNGLKIIRIMYYDNFYQFPKF